MLTNILCIADLFVISPRYKGGLARLQPFGSISYSKMRCDQGQIWIPHPPGVLHLCLLHQLDCDDVPHHRWHSCLEQLGS